MKRILITFLMLAFVLAACQQVAPPPTTPAPETTQALFAPVIGESGTGEVQPTSQNQGGYPEPGRAPAVVTEVSPGGEEVYPAPSLPGAGIIQEGPVTFNAADGTPLAGTVYGSGPVGVILAHMFGGSQGDWQPFIPQLTGAGYTVLAFDFRGFGETGGERSLTMLDQDIVGAADFLKAGGVSRVICVGASMGGTACANAAAAAGVSGLVVISSPLVMEAPLEITQATLKDLAIPKLFIAARDDVPYAGDVQQMFNWSAEPRQIEMLDGSQHGTNLFGGENSEPLSRLILDFLGKIP